MGRARRPVSTFAGLPQELKQALRAGVASGPLTEKNAAVERNPNVDSDASHEPDPELYAAAQRPTKRQRINSGESTTGMPTKTSHSVIPSDPASVVPFYSSADQVPEHLAKCAPPDHDGLDISLITT
jgi:hypothetical protein